MPEDYFLWKRLICFACSRQEHTLLNVIFVGFPIWWGREPSVVDTFLDGYDFAGKKIVPFCTSGGSGFGETSKRIQGIVGAAAKVEEGKRLGGTVSGKDLEIWIAGLGL